MRHGSTAGPAIPRLTWIPNTSIVLGGNGHAGADQRGDGGEGGCEAVEEHPLGAGAPRGTAPKNTNDRKNLTPRGAPP
jgi:hypothetical protein